MCFGQKADSQGQSPGEDVGYTVSGKIAGTQQFRFFKGWRENTIGVDLGLHRAPLQAEALCVFFCPCWRAWHWAEGAEGAEGWLCPCAIWASPTPEAPGRKLVRVVVLDLDPQFVAGLCFLPTVMWERGPMASRAKEEFWDRVGFSHLVAV